MEYVIGDLFNTPQGYYLAHCISGDFTLGAGIAKKFDEVYNMRYKLHKKHPIPDGERFGYVGKSLLVDNVFNIVTKERYFNKPTYEDLAYALSDMCDQMIALDATKLAMPKIGCGLDKLNWDMVEEIIHDIFDDTNIEVVIYSLK